MMGLELIHVSKKGHGRQGPFLTADISLTPLGLKAWICYYTHIKINT